MASTRDHIIETACTLLEAQGYHATGLNQIVKESGAPKGSLYYYFPDGKEELIAEAIDRAGKHIAERIRLALTPGGDIPTDLRRFVQGIANAVEASAFRTGGPLTTVAMETATTSERLNHACRQAYNQLLNAFASRLAESGLSPDRAAQLATFITAAIEGGIILSRTYHTGDPLRRVGQELEHLIRAALHEPSQ